MKSTILFLTAALASIAYTQPHRHHHARHHKRQEPGQEIVWFTEYDVVTETVDITTTIWVSEGFVPPATTPSVSTSSSSFEASSSPEVPAQFFQPASSSTSSVYVASTPESTYVAPVPTTSEAAAEPVYTSPVETPSTTSVAPAYVPESSSPAAIYTPPVETPAAAAAAAAPAATSSSTSSGSGSGSGDCTSASPCSGDITYYTAGLGACGITSDGDNDSVIALPVGMMGTQSNGNPYCGKTVTITCTKTGLSTTATVVDKCMGCTGNSIDLSTKAFAALDPTSMEADGRLAATWYFN